MRTGGQLVFGIGIDNLLLQRDHRVNISESRLVLVLMLPNVPVKLCSQTLILIMLGLEVE